MQVLKMTFLTAAYTAGTGFIISEAIMDVHRGNLFIGCWGFCIAGSLSVSYILWAYFRAKRDEEREAWLRKFRH